MVAARLVVVVALASLLAVQAAETSPSFVEWIKGSGKVQSAYEEVVSETGCLQTTEQRNCRCHVEKGGICVQRYDEVKLSCCESLDYEKYSNKVEDLLADKLSVGVCTVTSTLMDPISYATNADCKKIGEFHGTCELTEKAGGCGSPFCEGMAIVITGDILTYEKVGFMKALNPNTLDKDCSADIFTSLPTGEKKTPAKVEYSKGEDKDDGTKFLVGKGKIMAGTFSVVSRYHKTPYKTGEFQLVKSLDVPEKYEDHPTPPEKCYVAKDGAASLKFFKSSGDY